MQKQLQFFRSFVEHPLDVASIIPTSQRAAQRVAAKMPPDARVVVEYGPGTGVVSHAILALLPQDGTLILIEKTPEFAAMLRETMTDPRVRVLCDSAERIGKILKEAGFTYADAVFSSIPLSTMPSAVRTTIIRETYEALAEEAPFVVFLFRPIVAQYLRETFSIVISEVELRNLPPLQIFTALKTRIPPLR